MNFKNASCSKLLAQSSLRQLNSSLLICFGVFEGKEKEENYATQNIKLTPEMMMCQKVNSLVKWANDRKR